MNYNELKHYGVLGMKWGVRHDNLTTPRQYKKKLNELSVRSGAHTAEYIKNDYSAVKKRGRIKKYTNKLIAKGVDIKSDAKLARMKLRLQENEKMAKQHKKASDNINKETNSLITKAKKSGYLVSSKDTVELYNMGNIYLATALGGVVGGATYASLALATSRGARVSGRYKTKLDNGRTFNQSPNYVKRKAYKVSSY